MGEELKSVSICLLDDVSVRDCLKLDEFDIRYYQPTQLQALLGVAEGGDRSSEISNRLEVYSEFPWARVEQSLGPDQVKTPFDQCLKQHQLSYAHAGVRSWWPFDDLLRTLNLLKSAKGPVIGRQFYSWLEPLAEPNRRIDRIIYGEPLWDHDRPDSEAIHPLLFGYDMDPSDAKQFPELRKQLAQCLSADSMPDNSHMRTAVHYFENGDRKIVPYVQPGSFDAIEPLMSYEAALEALLVGENEGGVEDKLSNRITAVMGRTNGRTDKVKDFAQRVFWLRSKVAHGARPIEEIEELIVDKPNDEIDDKERNKKIPEGDYVNLLITDGSSFPGFLVNLRELARICIRFFCDELSAGRDKTSTIDLLKKTG